MREKEYPQPDRQMPAEDRGRKPRGRKAKRLRGFEVFVLAIGYLTIAYGIVRGLVYVAVQLVR